MLSWISDAMNNLDDISDATINLGRLAAVTAGGPEDPDA